MIITCDKCDTQFELDENPEQLADSKIQCIKCNAMLDADKPVINDRTDKPSKPRANAKKTKSTEKGKQFLRTDMPGKKKRKKKNKVKAPKSQNSKKKDVKGTDGDTVETERNLPDAVLSNAIAGGILNKGDDLDFLVDGKENSGTGDMVNEKTEVLSIDDVDDIDFKTGVETGKSGPAIGLDKNPDAEKRSVGPKDTDLDTDFSIDRELFLDIDLDGMGTETDSPKGLLDASDSDELDDMDAFALDLDDELPVDSDGETIVLDMDLDNESENFQNLFTEDTQKDSSSVNSNTATSSGLSDDLEDLEPFSLDLDGKLGDSDKDGMLDLFLDIDIDQMKTSGESRGNLLPEDGGLEIQDDDFDADGEAMEMSPMDLQNLEKQLDATGELNAEDDVLELNLEMGDTVEAASSDEAGLGLDENLLLDLDLDFDDDEQGLETVTAGSIEDGLNQDPTSGGALDDSGLGLEDDLLLDIDLDFDEDDQGLATVVSDGGEDALNEGSNLEEAPDDSDLGMDDDLLLDLDFDFDEDDQGLATVVADGKDDALEQGSALDDDLLMDLDLDVDEGGEAPPASDQSDAEGELSLELDLDAAEEALSLSEEDGVEPALTLELSPDETAGSEGTAPGLEEELPIELDLDAAEEALSLSEEDGVEPALALESSPDETAGSDDTAPGLEEELPIELDLDASEDGVEPALALETASDDVAEPVGTDPGSEEDFSIELDLNDAEGAPSPVDEDAAVLDAASEKEGIDVPAVLDGDSDSEDEFLFNMDLEKIEEAPDELELTAEMTENIEGAGDSDPELKTKSIDEPENFEVVEEVLLSSAPNAKTRETVKRDEEFIDAFDMGIPTDEFEELNEKRRNEIKPEKIAIGDEDYGNISAINAPVERRRLALPVLILLLLLLGALLFGAYSFGLFEGFNAKNIVHKIPIVKEYFPVPPKNVGEIATLENTINNRFVENKVTGTLFVVTGKVKNEFPTPRSYIQVVGKLFSTGKKPAGIENVYCGNSLTDAELNSLPSDQMRARLNNKAGNNNSNVNVQPGKTLPYTIVFYNLPERLEEFTVEVAGSRPSSG